MKKILMSILFVVLMSSMAFANVEVGDKIGDVLFTDIVTILNGEVVESFNINGSTAVYAKEAQKLGYDLNWNSEERIVELLNNPTKNPMYEESEITNPKTLEYAIGDKINDVLYTDIQTKINGKIVESFNINGSTAIYVTALKETGAIVEWISEKRRVRISNVTDQKEVVETYNIPIDAVVRIDDSFIYEDDYNKNIAMSKYLYESKFGKDIWDKQSNGIENSRIIKGHILDELIQVELIKDYVKENGEVEINEAEVNMILENFNTELAKDEERKAYYQEHAIIDEFIYELIKDRQYVNAFSNMIKKEIKTDNVFLQEKYENYIVKVDASHILVKDEAIAKKIYKKLSLGEEFSVLAKEFSIDPSATKNSGNLGFFSRGKMVPAFEEVAFSTDISSISQPFKTQFGYHILKVNNRKTIQDLIDENGDQLEINSYKSEIVEIAFEEKYVERLESLKHERDIKRYTDSLE